MDTIDFVRTNEMILYTRGVLIENVLACAVIVIVLVIRSCDPHDMIFVMKNSQPNHVDFLVKFLSSWHKSSGHDSSCPDSSRRDFFESEYENLCAHIF